MTQMTKLGTCNKCGDYTMIFIKNNLCKNDDYKNKLHTQTIKIRLNNKNLKLNNYYNEKINIYEEIKNFSKMIEFISHSNSDLKEVNKIETIKILAKLKLFIGKTQMKLDISDNDIDQEIHEILDNE